LVSELVDAPAVSVDVDDNVTTTIYITKHN